MTASREGAAATAGGAQPPATLPAALRSWRWWRPSRAAFFAFFMGLVITVALVLTSLGLYNRNERRLLNLRVKELNLVVAATVPTVQTPLASAAELANATGGSPGKFRAFMAPHIGIRPGQFVSVSLWPLGRGRPAPTVVAGARPVLASMPAKASKFFAGIKPGALNLTGILGSAHPRLGFAFTAAAAKRGYVVYAENPLPANRRSALERNSAFSDLDYVLYLGRSHRSSDVLVTSLRRLPIKGRKASEVVPFGAGAFTLVVAPKGSLGGAFFRDLPWIIAGVGALFALAAALLTDRLAQRRHRAEELAATLDRVAAENRDMYAEQRSISQMLQHALLPETLPRLSGLTVDARYVAAAADAEVGGDWYDIVAVDQRRALMVIGDISGHGLRAATNMALVRHATLAYAAQDSRPASVLSRLSDFVNSGPHDYFATVLCALIDVEAHRLTLASAGHMAPLLLEGRQARYVELSTGAPIGATRGTDYHETTVSVPPEATLVAFTDGLVERRGEVLDVGLARLRDLATRQRLALDALLDKLARDLASDERHDDTAIVGIQWQN
jgi:serine phosphatase RsbU (regulator of sigma subunit)